MSNDGETGAVTSNDLNWLSGHIEVADSTESSDTNAGNGPRSSDNGNDLNNRHHPEERSR